MGWLTGGAGVLSPQIAEMKKQRQGVLDYISGLLPQGNIPNPPTFGQDVPFKPSSYREVGRSLLGAVVPEPEDTVFGLMKPIIPSKLVPGLKSEPGYAYHATNEENLYEIAKDKLRTHKPWDFTEQESWPDGSIKKRSYWSEKTEHSYQFSPEGKPVILRTKLSKDFGKEPYTGDLYTSKLITPNKIEYLGEDGKWHPLVKLKE